MSRSNTLRCASGIVLAVSLLFPGLATAQGERSGGWAAARPEWIFSPARLWDIFLDLLAGKPAISSAEGDTGWQSDPNGDEIPAPPSPNTGWQIDPDG